ncbi:two-component system sensor histidine kinase DesK [Phycicoccus badiiscoriae]|uniref:Two-component system sensor histidine kinase DesK n=1 Tax=Pedococcus badiiscoriae TaxID=642776 RepID=A0A852WH26_9MICO|nr:two-component system sensor histidine kinase DesK [Pedococcus badiiscoriae]
MSEQITEEAGPELPGRAAGPDSGQPFFGHPGENTWRERAAGLVFAGIWLVFLADAVGAAWRQRQAVRADGGLVVLALFVVLYLLHFSHLRAAVWGTRGSIASRWYVTSIGLLYWAGLAVLAALATITIGQKGAATWVFLAVSGLWTFRVRIGLVIGGALVALYEFLTFHVDGWRHDASISMSMVLAMAAVTGGMIASQRQRALAEAREENSRLAIQDERNRMARDVHDILGHSLTVITVKAELAARLMEVDPERAKVEVADLERLARDALADVRQAVAGFRETSLPAELARARSSLAAAGIEADLPTAADAVPSHLRELCAWTLREGVTNVIRHSGATSCRVTLDERGITVADNGVGSRPGKPGTGLVGLKERAVGVGAQLLTRPVVPHGFELSVIASPAPRSAEPGAPERIEV